MARSTGLMAEAARFFHCFPHFSGAAHTPAPAAAPCGPPSLSPVHIEHSYLAGGGASDRGGGAGGHGEHAGRGSGGVGGEEEKEKLRDCESLAESEPAKNTFFSLPSISLGLTLPSISLSSLLLFHLHFARLLSIFSQEMAGGDYPKGVWSPAGGWYADPKHWRRGTALVVAGMAVVAFKIFSTSARLETRHAAPARPIPSRRWSNVPEARIGAGGATSLEK